MTHHVWKLLLAAIVVSAGPLAAQDASAVKAALANGNYGQAIALTKSEFASVRSAGEASNLIQAIIATAPADEIAPLVVAAVEGNPAFGQATIQGALQGATKDEAAAILTATYFSLSQNPSPFAALLSYISDLLSGTAPVNEVLTMPWFNPANSIGTTQTNSPATPGSR